MPVTYFSVGHDLGHTQEALEICQKSTKLKNIKVGHILLLSKSGSWVPGDACNFFWRDH